MEQWKMHMYLPICPKSQNLVEFNTVDKWVINEFIQTYSHAPMRPMPQQGICRGPLCFEG